MTPSAAPAAVSPRVICLGHTAFDATWTVERLPEGDGKTRALSYAERGGGMAATAAVAAARLGASAQFWGRAGHDAAGAAMRDELAAYGVNVKCLRLFDGARSSASAVIVDAQGERMIINFRGAALLAETDWLPLDAVLAADAVLADPRWPEGAHALFDAARRHGVPSVLDGDVAESDVFDALLPSVDFAVFSEPGLAGYVGEPVSAFDVARALRFARERGCRIAAVTLGERGLAWHDGASLQRLPAFPVRAVDTNGAGDVFHGALVFALGARWTVRDAFRFSAAVAALKCTRHGARDGVPDLAAALSFLAATGEPIGAC